VLVLMLYKGDVIVMGILNQKETIK
jgi:hypothetical protein